MESSNPFDLNLRAALEPAYALERELVGGGMSRVFLATERALNRSVVIKVLPPDLAAGVNRERFRREVQLAAQLQHPHIVPLYSAGEYGDLLFYTMPYIDGESLKHAIHERKGKSRFTPREVVGVLHDVVDALAYAHARGVVHRDIKPGNVLRSGRHAVVTDFGVAKAISAALPAVGTTTSGMAIGTPAYMAPEQLAGDPAADHRMDIYAVGLLGYELLAGEAPFNEASPQATMVAQLTRSPVPISSSREDVPPALSALITKCLEKNPAARPQTAAELLIELDALAFLSGDYLPLPEPRRARTVAMSVGAALLTLAGVGLAVRAWMSAENAVPSVASVVASVTPAAPARGAATRAALTHADSLAIAKAVDARVAERTAATPVSQTRRDSAMLAKLGDSLRATMMKAVFDSLEKTQPHGPPGRVGDGNRASLGVGGDRGTRASYGPSPQAVDSMVRAMRASMSVDRANILTGRSNGQPSREAIDERLANIGPPRRVLVTLPPDVPGRPDMTVASAAIADSLRRMLKSSQRYVVVATRDSFTGDPHGVDSLTKVTNADMAVSVLMSTRRDSAVYWILLLRDETANDAYNTKSVSIRAAKDSLLAPLDSLLARSMRYLTSMDRTPRRGAVDPVDHAFEQRAANMGPPRRIVVWDHPPDGQQDVRDAGSALMDVLRKSLANTSRYLPVSRDSTLAELGKSRDRNIVLSALHADLMVSIRGSARRDSVAWTLTVRDLSATPSPQRSVTGPLAPMSSPLLWADTLAIKTMQALEELDHMPRKPAPAP